MTIKTLIKIARKDFIFSVWFILSGIRNEMHKNCQRTKRSEMSSPILPWNYFLLLTSIRCNSTPSCGAGSGLRMVSLWSHLLARPPESWVLQHLEQHPETWSSNSLNKYTLSRFKQLHSLNVRELLFHSLFSVQKVENEFDAM